MEPRNEVINKLSSKEIFFQNHLVELEHEQPQIYSLEEEFAKTKKNRDLKPYVIFFGFICLLIGATAVTANYLEEKTKQINIDISDFEDLQLKETLSSAKETGEKLNQLTVILDIKTKELNSKAKELNNKNQELNIKTKELNSKTQELNNVTREVNQWRSTFDSRVQKAREEIQHDADLKNADKKALKRLEEQSKKQLDNAKKDYDKKIYAKQAENDRLQQQVKDFASCQYGLNIFLKDLKAAGCVMDPRQRKNILLYFPKDPSLFNETVVELYRAQNEYIGKIKLIPGGSGLRAEIVELASGQNIKPLDWFRLK